MKYLLLALIVLFLPKPVQAMHLSGENDGKQIYKQVKVSWYAKGLKNPEAFTTACWSNFPKGTKFHLTSRNSSVVVTCNDRGNFKPMGRFLDLSSGAFRILSPLSRGIITVDVEVLK